VAGSEGEVATDFCGFWGLREGGFLETGSDRWLVGEFVAVLHCESMSTIAEIEAAVERLPRRQQGVLLQKLAKRLIGPSCYDLARDLFEKPGKLGASGKKDLSTNKAHMAGFGR
jgi:hypothetical protein